MEEDLEFRNTDDVTASVVYPACNSPQLLPRLQMFRALPYHYGKPSWFAQSWEPMEGSYALGSHEVILNNMDTRENTLYLDSYIFQFVNISEKGTQRVPGRTGFLSLASKSLLSVSCSLEQGLWPHFHCLVNGASGKP